jgi:hypothetical protein
VNRALNKLAVCINAKSSHGDFIVCLRAAYFMKTVFREHFNKQSNYEDYLNANLSCNLYVALFLFHIATIVGLYHSFIVVNQAIHYTTVFSSLSAFLIPRMPLREP